MQHSLCDGERPLPHSDGYRPTLSIRGTPATGDQELIELIWKLRPKRNLLVIHDLNGFVVKFDSFLHKFELYSLPPNHEILELK